MSKYYKFLHRNKNQNLEPWTGRFKTKKAAKKWFAKYGDYWHKRGINLILISYKKGTE